MHDATAGPCANCGGPLAGPYCSSCGQKATASRPALADLLHEGLHELTHLDGKMLGTLRLLITRPGTLTREFIDGRRARYLTPIRLYLVCSVIFFGVVSLLPARPWHVRVTNASNTRLEEGAARVNRNPALLAESFEHNLPKAMFVLMPLFGALVFLFNRRVEPMYVPHLYFAVHYHAFLFLLLTAVAGLTAIRSLWTMIPGLLLPLVSLPYLAVALRRVYGGGGLATVLKSVAIWVIYGGLVIAAVTGLMLLTLFRASG
jgi:hypothetical protein